MEVQAMHYYAKNHKGDILFKIELSSIEAFPWLRFTCSLDVDFNKYKTLKKMIEKLCAPETSPEGKAELVQKVISVIKRIEGIDELYFKNRQVDEEPQLSNGVSKLLNHIFSQDDFKEYTPFSSSDNSYFFEVLRSKLGSPQQLNTMMEVEKDCFESLIKGHKKLEDEYVNYYSPNAKFFIRGVCYEEDNFEFYFMKTYKIVLIFYVEA